MNLEPTRINNILDLSFTSTLGLVRQTQTGPGIMIMTIWLSWTQITEPTYIKRNHIQFTNTRKQTGVTSAIKEVENKQEIFVSSLPAECSVQENWERYKKYCQLYSRCSSSQESN